MSLNFVHKYFKITELEKIKAHHIGKPSKYRRQKVIINFKMIRYKRARVTIQRLTKGERCDMTLSRNCIYYWQGEEHCKDVFIVFKPTPPDWFLCMHLIFGIPFILLKLFSSASSFFVTSYFPVVSFDSSFFSSSSLSSSGSSSFPTSLPLSSSSIK